MRDVVACARRGFYAEPRLPGGCLRKPSRLSSRARPGAPFEATLRLRKGVPRRYAPRDDTCRLATGITNRIDVRRAEKAAILLSTRPAASPAFCTSIQRNGN